MDLQRLGQSATLAWLTRGRNRIHLHSMNVENGKTRAGPCKMSWPWHQDIPAPPCWLGQSNDISGLKVPYLWSKGLTVWLLGPTPDIKSMATLLKGSKLTEINSASDTNFIFALELYNASTPKRTHGIKSCNRLPKCFIAQEVEQPQN